MMTEELTQEEREEFLRAQGWSPEMDPAQRAAIEEHWTDTDIRMAKALGLS